MWYDNEKDFSILNGKTIIGIGGDRDEELIFKCSDGSQYRMFHAQDCCENVYLEDIIGDLDALIGSPIVKAEEVTNYNKNPEGVEVPEYQDSFTWTFYHLTNKKGEDVTLRWYGESNGFYSESVDFVEITE